MPCHNFLFDTLCGNKAYWLVRFGILWNDPFNPDHMKMNQINEYLSELAPRDLVLSTRSSVADILLTLFMVKSMVEEARDIFDGLLVIANIRVDSIRSFLKSGLNVIILNDSLFKIKYYFLFERFIRS